MDTRYNPQRRTRIGAFVAVLLTLLSLAGAAFAQTNPAAQAIPYSQNFTGLTSPTYPAGWQGWTISTTPPAAFNTAAPIADRVLTSGTAASTAGNVYNYVDKVGFLNTGALDLTVVLAVNTTGSANVQVQYDIATIRNPQDGTNNRVNEVTLQYRVGTSGSFTNLTGIEYQNLSGAANNQTAAVTTPQNPVTESITLPAACDNQPVVQLRLASRQVSGAGGRPSFSIDNVSVTPGASFTINASAGTGGTITPSGAVTVASGGTQAFTIAADACYSIADVLVDGNSVGPVTTYTFTNVTANHTIDASFSLNGPYTINASAGAGGTISPSGAVSVNCGADQSFTITPGACAVILDVTVDGNSVGAVASYSFTNVQTNHTIFASFAAAGPFTINSSAGPNGSISPNGATVVACGGSQGYTITPDGGYGVSDVVVDGNSVGAVTSYTFSNVTANHTISASFASLGSFTINASAGAGGNIAPSGAVVVTGGSDQSFTITADACFAISDVLVDGNSVGPVSSYTFQNVLANHTIAASFAQIQYTLTATTSGSGSGSLILSPPGGVYNCGQVVSVTASANAGSHFDVWSGAATGHTPNPVNVTMDGNKSIDAAFLLNVYSWNVTVGSASFATSTNWTPTRFSNASDDVLQFNAGGSSTATGVTTQTIGQLTVSNSTSIALQSASAQNVTIAGGAGTDFDVAAASTLNLNGASALTLTLGSGTAGSVSGTINVNTGAHRILPPNSASALQFQSGSLCEVGTGFSGNLFGTTSLNAVSFNSGSIYGQSAGSNPFGAGQPASVTVFQTGSRYRLDGPLIPSMSGRTYADFECNVPTPGYVVTPSGGAALKVDNVIMTQGFIRWGMTGQFDIKGNITVGAGTTLLFAPAAAATVSLSGLSPQTITVAPGGVLSDSTIETIEVKNASGIVLASDVTLPGTFKFTIGNVNTGANTLSITGNTSSITGAGVLTGWVNGNLRRTLVPVANEASRSYDIGDASNYTPVALAVHGVPGPFDLAAHTTTPDHPNLATSGIDPAKSVNRYYTLSPSGSPTFSTYDATFNFVSGDVDGPANTANFIVQRYDGTWHATGTGTRTSTSTQATGVASFSDFAIGQPTPHTITASAGAGGSIAPSGAVLVADGDNQSFTITADPCFTIQDVLVDAVSVGAVSSYTFTNVTSDHTIAASFAAVSPTVTVVVTSDVNPSTFGQPVTFTATLNPPTVTGTVTFRDSTQLIGTVPISGGVAQIVKSNLITGLHTFIRATFNGDACHPGNQVSAPYAQRVVQVVTDASVVTNVNPKVCGEQVRLSGIITPIGATGQVIFRVDGNFAGSANINPATGVATLFLGNMLAGKHNLTCEYNGNVNYIASSSAEYSVTCSFDASSVSMVTSQSPAKFGAQVTFTATVQPDDAFGTVDFFDGATYLGTADVQGDHTASYSFTTQLAPGTHSNVHAVYSGDGCHDPSTSSDIVQEITPDAQPVVTVLFPNGGEKFCLGGDVKLVWNATDNTAVTSVQLEVSRDFGGTWQTIVASMPNTGSYVWRVTPPSTSVGPTTVYSALLRVTATDNAGVTGSDESNNYFAISDCALAVTVTRLDAVPADDGIQLRWAFSEASAFAKVVIERSATEEGPWSEISADMTDDVGETVATDRSAEANRTYFYRLVGTSAAGSRVVFGPVRGTSGAPREFSMSAAWPNPSRGQLSLKLAVPKTSNLRLTVVDLQGREVAELMKGAHAPGTYQVHWDGRTDRGPVPAGLYFLRLVTPDKDFNQRVTIAR